MTTGVLLINLGTPDSTSVNDVRKYLRQFLSDPYVIDINPIARFLLLNLVILPTRPKKSAEAYRAIWQDEGSPLLVNSVGLANNAQLELGDDFQVALGMRYGNPSIASAVEQLKLCDEIIVLPLFPQYSLAATETAIQHAMRAVKPHWADQKIKVIRDFYDNDTFIAAQAALVHATLQTSSNDSRMVLFSYHGLPERQIDKASPCVTLCDKQNTCPAINDVNRDCYRAQCYATSRALADKLNLTEKQYMTSFQSRLGRIPWIKPYTDELLDQLIKQGIKHLIIACPSFVCDCLETLEEIGIRAREQWLTAGGDSLSLVPCVNSNAHWVCNLITSVD